MKMYVTGIFPPSILPSLALDPSLLPSLVSVTLLSTLRDIVKITEQNNVFEHTTHLLT